MGPETSKDTRFPSPEPDVMAATLDRLVQLVREQEAQIRALRAIIETLL